MSRCSSTWAPSTSSATASPASPRRSSPRCCSASSARWSRPSPPRRRCSALSSRSLCPFLQAGTGVSAIGFIAAMAVASTIVDVSPFSTNGALVLANAQGIDRQVFFRRLLSLRRDRDRCRPGGGLAPLRRAAGMSPRQAAAALPDRKEMPVRKSTEAPRESRSAFLGDLLDTLTERGRSLLGRRDQPGPVARIAGPCDPRRPPPVASWGSLGRRPRPGPPRRLRRGRTGGAARLPPDARRSVRP